MSRLRILHVLGPMNRGGVETWLLHVLRNLDRQRLQMDFLVHTDKPAAYDAELQSLGARILPCPMTQSPHQYARRFQEIVKLFGPFDVVHSHVHYFSGFVLSLARAARIPVRISHSHSSAANAQHSLGRKLYRIASRWLIDANCTHGLAASAPAAAELYGAPWRHDPRFEVLHCGIDLAPFHSDVDRLSVRSEFGFSPSDLVFGHVGRFDAPKNHAGLVDIAAEIVTRQPDARFLFVGDGPLRPAIEEKARRAGIAGRTVFAGGRSDVPRLMMGAMDRFLFPSLHEGLGLALIEAQAAGLPATISDAVPSEADAVPQLITRLSLRQSAAAWAERALHHQERRTIGALEDVERSSFNVVTGMRKLVKVYGD